MSAPVLSRTPSSDEPDVLRRLTRAPLLTHDDERDLSALIQAGQTAQAILDGTQPGDGRSPEVLRQTARDGRRARDRFIEANLRLVTSMARRYANRGLPLDDLIQEGSIGLARAVDKYDGTKGVHFHSYATWWIRQALVIATDTDRIVSRPLEVEAALRKIHAIAADLSATGNEPTVERIAAQADMTVAEVTRLRALDHVEVSLDLRLATNTDSGATLGDLLPDPEATAAFAQIDETYARDSLRQALHATLNALSPDQAAILRLRFGLDGETPATLEAAGTALGLDRLAARRLEGEALAALRETATTRGLAEHL